MFHVSPVPIVPVSGNTAHVNLSRRGQIAHENRHEPSPLRSRGSRCLLFDRRSRWRRICNPFPGWLQHRSEFAGSPNGRCSRRPAKFQKQVQEWPDILLRGHNPDAPRHVSRQFLKKKISPHRGKNIGSGRGRSGSESIARTISSGSLDVQPANSTPYSAYVAGNADLRPLTS